MSSGGEPAILHSAAAEGFTSLSSDATEACAWAAKGMLAKVLGQACQIAAVAKVRTIKVEHLNLVYSIQSGGKAVLPDEYFSGAPSGAYKSEDAVRPLEAVTSTVDPAVETRGAMPVKGLGGGSGSGSSAHDRVFVQGIIAQLTAEGALGCKLDAASIDYVSRITHWFIVGLFKAVRKSYPRQKSLTGTMIRNVAVKKNLV